MEKLNSLREQVQGPVFAPDDDGYLDEVTGVNLAVVNRPAAVVGAATADDVVAAIRFATANGLPIRVQLTGHAAGSDISDGMLVTTRRLRELVIDPQARTARIGAGLVWQDVIDAIAKHGLATACGSAPNVGVIGYLLGGGVSPIGRTYGFGADHVSAMEVVTADGAVRQVDADTDPEMFWALRGGKAGVGIVTSATVNLFELPSLYGGGLFFGADRADAALRGWARWAPTLSDRTTSSVGLLRLPDLPAIPPQLRDRFVVHIRLAHIGDDAEGESVAAPLRAIGEPLLDTIARMPFAAIGSIHADPTEPQPIWATGCQLRDFPDEAATALLEAAGPAADVPLVVVELRQLGGAIADSTAPLDAMSGRDADFVAFVVGAPVPDLFATVIPAAANRVLAALSPWTLRGPQANFASDGNDVAALSSSWPAPVYSRLQQLKTRYDPADVFRFGAVRAGESPPELG